MKKQAVLSSPILFTGDSDTLLLKKEKKSCFGSELKWELIKIWNAKLFSEK